MEWREGDIYDSKPIVLCGRHALGDVGCAEALRGGAVCRCGEEAA